MLHLTIVDFCEGVGVLKHSVRSVLSLVLAPEGGQPPTSEKEKILAEKMSSKRLLGFQILLTHPQASLLSTIELRWDVY